MKNIFRKPVVGFTVKLIVSLTLIIGLIYYIDINTILESFKKANPLLITCGFLFVAANISIHFIRWRYLLKLITDDIKSEEIFTAIFVGMTAGFFTPAQIGEVAGRMAGHPNLPKSQVGGIVIIDKLYIFAFTLITGTIALSIFVMTYYASYWNYIYSMLAVIFIIVLMYIFLLPYYSKKLLEFIPKKIREHRLMSIIPIIEERFHNREGRTLFLLTILLYSAIFIQYFVFISAFEPVGFFEALMCASAVYFVKAVVLPISIGDLGIRESASVFFFTAIGISAATAFSASLCMFAANLIIPSVIGSLFVLRIKTK